MWKYSVPVDLGGVGNIWIDFSSCDWFKILQEAENGKHNFRAVSIQCNKEFIVNTHPLRHVALYCVPMKSDSDEVLCLQMLSKKIACTLYLI